MELRRSLEGSQAAAGAAVARTLLREAQRPAAAVSTFAAMLGPRMPAGDPGRDLAAGIALQGQRLQAVSGMCSTSSCCRVA